MKFLIMFVIFLTVLMLTKCNTDQKVVSPYNSTDTKSNEGYLKLYFVEEGIYNPLPPDSIPSVALDSLIIPEKYEKRLSPAKIIDFKKHYTILGGGAIDLTVSGSVYGCDKRVYFFEPESDSTYSVISFEPGPFHHLFTGSIIPDPQKEYAPIYALFLDADNDNSGSITLNFSNGDTTLSYAIDAAKHTFVLDESVYRFKLNQMDADSSLYLIYLDGKSNFNLNYRDPFFIFFPVITDSSGYQNVYKLINITRGNNDMGIFPWTGHITFPDEYGYAFRVKFPHKNK